MSEILLEERSTFVDFSIYRKMCSLKNKQEKSLIYKQNKKNVYDLFGGSMLEQEQFNDKRKHKEYFHGVNPSDFEYIKCFQTQDDKLIKKIYGDPFSDVKTHNFVRKIIKDGDKIKIELNVYSKTRDRNQIYFTRHYDTRKVIFNLKTGNITTFHVYTKGKKIEKKIRINKLSLIERYFNVIYHITDSINKNAPNEVFLAFNDSVFAEILSTTLGFNSHKSTFTFYDHILPIFIYNRKIKVPNNYSDLIVECYPTEKYLKKNDRKLVLSILDYHKIKSGKANSILNMYPSKKILYYLKYVITLFGHEYLQFIELSNFKHMYSANTESKYFSFSNLDRTYQQANIFDFKITRQEKMRLINLMNQKSFNFDVIIEIIDHIKMVKDLKSMGVKHIIRANDTLSFRIEHARLSEEIYFLEKGYYGSIVYDDSIDVLENPINIINKVYKPVLLRTQLEYREEGNIQHHCVGTYFDHSRSIIISIRCDNERVTCEFDVKTGNTIQMRYVCNEKPPEHFGPALLALENKVKILAKKDLLMRKHTFLTPISIPQNQEDNMELAF
jgi:hypothetical protein